MSKSSGLARPWLRESAFLLRDRTAVSGLLVLLIAAVIATVIGLQKVRAQEDQIQEMIAADAADREAVQATLTTFGDAAYYSFFITYDPPAPLAFAAYGQRDTAPYLKRIRLLALEGQIYSGESPNPLLAQIGSLDLSFVAAYVLPLILIVLLYDLRAGERAGGRLYFLEAMPNAWRRLWLPRILWRSVLAFATLAVPFLGGALIAGASAPTVGSALLGLAAVCGFWAACSALLARLPWRAPTIGAALVGLWLTLNVLIPAAAQNLIVLGIEGPEGADIALLQREAVNDAWDVPKSATLAPFAEIFPDYTIDEELDGFDWRWYFAFQHMGDVAAQELSLAYREAIRKRDAAAGKAAWVSPALAIQRHLRRLAHTGTEGQLAYDAAIRRYHQALQKYFLPLLFNEVAFDRARLADYPPFQPSTRS